MKIRPFLTTYHGFHLAVFIFLFFLYIFNGTYKCLDILHLSGQNYESLWRETLSYYQSDVSTFFWKTLIIKMNSSA